MISKRLSLSLLAVAATSLVVSAASFALFSDSTSNENNNFVTGNVSLGGSVLWAPPIPVHIVPGDSGGGTYMLHYTGNVPAHIGMKATMTGDSANCDASLAGDEFTISINGNTVPIDNVIHLLQDLPGVGNVPVNLAWSLNRDAGNTCQDKTFTLNLYGYAVQSAHNPQNPGDPIQWQ